MSTAVVECSARSGSAPPSARGSVTRAPHLRPCIGVLVDRLEDEYQNQVFRGIHAAALERDASVFFLCGGIIDAPYQSGRERNFAYDLVSPAAFGGLIIMSGSLSNHIGPARLGAYCARFAPIPMCSIGVRLAGVPGVLIDNASGLTRSIDGLIESGRRRVAFIRGPEQNEEAALRYEAYQRALARREIALDPKLVVLGDFQKESGAQAIDALCAGGQSFDAVVAANDDMALGALEALLDRSIAVPDEVAVSGFDDVEDARFARVPLSTVRQPLAEQGQRALAMLLDQIERGIPPRDVILPTELVERASSGVAGRRPQVPHAAAAEYEQARERLQQTALFRALRRSGEALSSTLAEQEVLAAARRELSGIGIERASICLYEPLVHAEQRVRCVRIDTTLASGDPTTEPRDEVIAASEILPAAVRQSSERRTVIVEPLFSNDGPLGVSMFEAGPIQGTVYEFLREQISAALQTSTLIKRLVSETARRQAAEKVQTSHELEIAARIQTAVLPRELAAPGLDLAAKMIAATEVGGDYYDVLPFDGGCWLAIGDVAGHGLRTGLIMLMIQSAVAGLCARSPGASPSELLTVINEVLYENVRERLQRDEHATLALIRYTSDGQLTIAGGHGSEPFAT
jgi:DNA-binding LacI/PurR family transcriptional regulator